MAPEVTQEEFEAAWRDDGSGPCAMCGEPHHASVPSLRGGGGSGPLVGDHWLASDLLYHDHQELDRMLRDAKVPHKARRAIHRHVLKSLGSQARSQARISTEALAREWFGGVGEYIAQVHEHDDGTVGIHVAPISIVGKVGDVPDLHGHDKGAIVH